MSENKMAGVAKLLGVELGEKFRIKGYSPRNKYFITELKRVVVPTCFS